MFSGPPVELKNQLVPCLLSEPSLALREVIKSGASNLKERLFIQLEPDKSNITQYLRRGDVHLYRLGAGFVCSGVYIF